MRERVFGKGDLKYLILDTLRDQPRHGYDIIRELEHRSGGLYTPSAGAVYPTLQMLEDMGAVTQEQQEGRKVYTITDEGRRILDDRRDVLDEIAGRVRDWVRREGGSELGQAMRELGELMALLGREGGRAFGDAEKLRRVREVIARTREELSSILRDEARTTTL
ncbi:MAG TPA: PadR family transcriptional regulator [Chloroflexota bacterium]|nr:PadR family transcriptional regulator [Chloroflexota bacterium]